MLCPQQSTIKQKIPTIKNTVSNQVKFGVKRTISRQRHSLLSEIFKKNQLFCLKNLCNTKNICTFASLLSSSGVQLSWLEYASGGREVVRSSRIIPTKQESIDNLMIINAFLFYTLFKPRLKLEFRQKLQFLQFVTNRMFHANIDAPKTIIFSP